MTTNRSQIIQAAQKIANYSILTMLALITDDF